MSTYQVLFPKIKLLSVSFGKQLTPVTPLINPQRKAENHEHHHTGPTERRHH